MNWYLAVLNKYAQFSGRARRSEYWMFLLMNFVIFIVLGIIGSLVKMPNILIGLYFLAILIPSLAVSFRRLHDTDRSAWWILIALVPLIGSIVLIVFYALPGTLGDNTYGSDPKAAG